MRIFVSLLVSLFFANAAWAQNSHEEIEYNPFGVPEQVVKVIVPNKLAIEEPTTPLKFPLCSDASLIDKLQNILKEDNLSLDNESIIQKRARILAAKNMTNFSPVDVKTFRPEINREIANIMITAKINQGLTNDDFAICAGDNPILKRRVYLLMQRKDTEIAVSVVNYRIDRIPSFVLN
ncbi:MAG: hypothetical protein IKA03_03520 [Alphaproteobacteria bacterium]|nr:hypothetical protein [Alphaproteobacteria bacterium]